MTAIAQSLAARSASPVSSDRERPKLGFFSQLALAAHLDSESWRAVAEDASSTWKVALLVALGGLARGSLEVASGGPAVLGQAVVLTALAWGIVAGLVWYIARPRARRPASPLAVLRATGMAAYPFVLLFVGLNALSVPGVVTWLLVATHGLALFALVDATRAVLGLTTREAVGTCALALAIPGLPLVVLLAPHTVM